jgi:hypothetical protein
VDGLAEARHAARGFLAIVVAPGCFFVRLEARFFVPARAFAVASRAAPVKDARLRAREGLSLTGASTAPCSFAPGAIGAPL